jgi:hypothetical protein
MVLTASFTGGPATPLYEETAEKRVYKIETLSITEDGFVDITGTHQPIALNGGLATIQFDPRQFLVES